MKVTFQEYLDQGINLNEASLNRIYQHIRKENVDSWAILTSWRDENTQKQNENDFKELKSLVRSKGYGFIEIEGVGQEEDDEGGIKQVKEPSLFIPDITYEDAQELSDKFNQWGYVYSGPEIEKGEIALISKQGIDYLGKFHPNKIAQFFSKVKGRSFTFESIKVNSWFEGKYWENLKKYE